MLLFFYRYLCGYVLVEFVSQWPEKLLNLCVANGISVWKVHLNDKRLCFKIGISSFKEIRKYKRNISGKIHIVKKCGVPFLIAKNKKRYGMLVGFVLFLTILYFLSGFIWNIEINGNQNVSDKEIYDCLKDIGIYEGVAISKINPENHRNELLLKMKDISWAAINIEGSRLTLDITEVKKKEENSTIPSNLKADSDGIIKSIEVISGVANVKVGDVVRKGDLLVSGVIEYQDMHTEFVRSRGKITAEVEKSFSVKQPLKISVKKRTGKKQKRTVLEIFGIKIPLYFGRINKPYESEKTEIKTEKNNAYLPIRLISKSFYYTEEKMYTISENEAKNLALTELESEINDYLNGGKISDKKISYIIEKDNIVVSAKIKCEKSIIFEEKLLLNTRN